MRRRRVVGIRCVRAEAAERAGKTGGALLVRIVAALAAGEAGAAGEADAAVDACVLLHLHQAVAQAGPYFSQGLQGI